MIDNKSLIGIIIQNLSKSQRIPRIRGLLSFLVEESKGGRRVKPEEAIAHLGLRGKVYDVNMTQTSPGFSDDTKSAVFLKRALESAVTCPLCGGLLDPSKSVSYDHINPLSAGGTGDCDNARIVHPYCNSIREV